MNKNKFITKVAKRFRWEGSHRLPWHEGVCKNLHGHSYRMTVELEGAPDENGFLMDFQAIKQILQPLIDAFDHGTLVANTDTELLHIMQQTSWKHYVLPYDSTTENVCQYVTQYLLENGEATLRKHHVRKIRVHVAETETCYAETEYTF